jgi:DNA-binding NarL/FixJ family response regulator
MLKLSKRQLDVFKLVVLGWKYREIAKELGISTGSIYSYLRAIYPKIGARNRVEAIHYALKNEIVKNLYEEEG